MIKIKVSTSSPELSSLFLRQTPANSGLWKGCQFFVNEPVERCDWWVVCHNSALRQPETTLCDPDHVVFISMEPTEGSTPKAFFEQFSKLVLSDRGVIHPDIRYENGTTWWVGINVRHENGHHFSRTVSQDYDSFVSMQVPEKSKRISVICSRTQQLPGHFKRLEFLDKLKNHPISQHIDFFGGGHNPILDKLDAIAPYKYHLALENSVVPDYWSEKLGDPFLGFSLPIYYGCPNIGKYFSEHSLIKVDIDDFEETVGVLERLIRDDPYESYLPEISKARSLVINQYNIFQLMADVCNMPASRYVRCRAKPASHFVRSWPRRVARKIIYRLRGIQSY